MNNWGESAGSLQWGGFREKQGLSSYALRTVCSHLPQSLSQDDVNMIDAMNVIMKANLDIKAALC